MPKLTIRERVPLAPLTTFDVGGPAAHFAEITNEEEAAAAITFAKERGLPLFILGRGSNIVVADAGFPGLVIRNGIRGFTSRVANGRTIVEVGAGEEWDDVVARCVEEDLSGIECISGVPGTAGAAPVENIGCYGQSADNVIREVRAIDLTTGAAEVFDNGRCAFSYRNSIFRRNPGRYLVLSVTLALTPGGAPTLTYHDLARRFDGKAAPTLREVRQAVLEIRNAKGMVMLPGYERYQSAGSFFKNPVVSGAAFIGVKARIEGATARGGCAPPWYWELPSGEVKVAAACLLQSAGFGKGYRDGAAGISPKHSLALMNCGGASAADIVRLARAIQERVRELFGVVVTPEVEFVGFDEYPLLREERSPA